MDEDNHDPERWVDDDRPGPEKLAQLRERERYLRELARTDPAVLQGHPLDRLVEVLYATDGAVEPLTIQEPDTTSWVADAWARLANEPRHGNSREWQVFHPWTTAPDGTGSRLVRYPTPMRAILELLIRGLDHAEIAAKLGYTPRNVRLLVELARRPGRCGECFKQDLPCGGFRLPDGTTAWWDERFSGRCHRLALNEAFRGKGTLPGAHGTPSTVTKEGWSIVFTTSEKERRYRALLKKREPEAASRLLQKHAKVYRYEHGTDKNPVWLDRCEVCGERRPTRNPRYCDSRCSDKARKSKQRANNVTVT